MGEGFEIKFDANFGRNLEREVTRMAQGHIDNLAKEGNRAANRVLASHGGQPVDVIKPILQREMKRPGFTITDPELTEYAQQISEGGRVSFKGDRIK